MADGIVQDMEIEKLKAIYFERLLEQLKTNERHQEDQVSLLLEMFLAYIHSKQISFKEFMRIIIDETIKRLEIKLQSDRKSNLYSNNKWGPRSRKECFHTFIK